jgi:NAD(P)-dependent dehydrogenase (short-subunit alcohol dehydrogenase family)
MTSRAVLVTGTSSGIGKAVALHLVRAGWPVYATARKVDTLKDLADAGCKTLPCDVTDEASMKACVEAIEAEHGAVGALVNNAGYSQSGAVETVPIAAMRAQFETNVWGAMRLCQLVLPKMREQRAGRIVNISSMGGTLVFPGGGVYHATKYAMEALSDALRFEVQGFGVQVVIVQPGLIRTGFSSAATSAMDAHLAKEGPYAKFNATVASATHSAYETGPMARFGGGPERVAVVVERALAGRRPRTRYKVTASASIFMTLRRWLPDRWWDAMMAGSFPLPQ